MAAKPTFISGKRSARGQPLAEPATDGFPAEEDVSNPPPGSDQDADEDEVKAEKDGRPRKKPD